MADRFPGAKFAVFAAVCVVAAAYVLSVTGNYGRSALPFVGDDITYQAVLSDVAGLFPGDDVKLAGVSVGRVEDIAIERGNAVVTFAIDGDIAITDAWEAGARWRNVIGQRYLYLYDVAGGAPLEPGGRLPVGNARPVADISRFFNEITPLLQAIDPQQQNRLLAALNTALVGREETVAELLGDLGTLSSTLADEEGEIRSVLDNGAALLEAYQQRDAQLRAFLDDLADAGGTLAARNDELLAAISEIGAVQQRFGELLRANEAELDTILADLEQATAIVAGDRDAFEATVANMRDGLATYMLISRWGQWFNVRAVAVQAQHNGQVIVCRTESGAECSAPNSDGTGRDNAPGRADDVSLAPARLPALPSVLQGALQDGGAA